jgi:DNA-binding MarR family transcriptional regulator
MQTRHNKLNANQIQILLLLFKYRYVTAALLARHKGINKSAATKSLRILLEQDYIARRYDTSYRLLGKSASYCLTPKGIGVIREHADKDEGALRAIYKDRRATDSFIEHNLSVMEALVQLKSLYGSHLMYFTRSQIIGFDIFPSPGPPMYMRESEPAEGEEPKEYMLEIYTDTPAWIIRKRIDEYITHFDEEGWSKDRRYPTLLFVAPTKRIERHLQKYIETARDDAYIPDEDLVFMTTTVKDLFTRSNTFIWTDVNNAGGRCRL